MGCQGNVFHKSALYPIFNYFISKRYKKSIFFDKKLKNDRKNKKMHKKF